MKLVGMVVTKWAPHLPDRAFRVLVRMAMTALDEPTERTPASIYFGGRDLLYSVMRMERNGNMAALEKATVRAIADLIELGAIERTNRAGNGKRQEYKLTLFNAIRIDGRAVDKPEQPTSWCPPQEDTSVQQQDTSGEAEEDTSVQVGGHPRVPQGVRGELQDYLKEQNQDDLVVEVPRVTDARANEEFNPAIANPESKCGHPDCVLGYRYDKTRPKHERNYPCTECHPNVIPLRRPA